MRAPFALWWLRMKSVCKWHRFHSLLYGNACENIFMTPLRSRINPVDCQYASVVLLAFRPYHMKPNWYAAHWQIRRATICQFGRQSLREDRKRSIEIGFCYHSVVQDDVCMPKIHVIFHESYTRHPYEIIIGIIAVIKTQRERIRV